MAGAKCMLSAALLCLVCVTYGQDASIKVPPPPSSPPDAMTTMASADVTTAAAMTQAPGDPTCSNKLDKCQRYENYNCIGIYESWAKENCARYCGYCLHPDDAARKCEDKIDNCAEYQNDTCSDPQYRIFAEDSCAKFCNKCDFRARYIIALEQAPKTTPAVAVNTAPASGCRDLVDYCWNEPDINCFGIYEPWARKNCPFRCGFCPEKPKCEDEILYCAQFGMGVCSDPQYEGWARKNCRKMCQLCAVPTRPAGQATMVPGATGPTVAPTSSGNSPQKDPNFLPTGNGTFLGQKSTFVIQGDPSSVAGACFYKGKVRPLDLNWNDGCDYICNCFDATRNRVICTQRCTQWGNLPAELTGCSLVAESDSCCKRLECNA